MHAEQKTTCRSLLSKQFEGEHMPRTFRTHSPGFYHLVNRGVGLREVFLTDEDRLFFINFLCDLSHDMSFKLHEYALISNGYNLLVETIHENLSEIMRTLNGAYARYFNQRTGRRGHVWEGRFRSWRIEDASMVLDILSYIESLPEYTGSVTDRVSYRYACYRQFTGKDEILPCLKDSIVFAHFNSHEEIESFLSKPIDVVQINRMHEMLRRASFATVPKRRSALPSLNEDYFLGHTREERNQKIHRAYRQGYSQRAIASALGISQQAVHKIIKKVST